ncbi:hypothetical protein ACIPC1_29185 [Streptomyces sp. NPDC087263]|uniref:hypothetical protein n=1 Tax=Streptomyces sp. NPDC087263 TaxID=3365773 RepID=UPI003801D929
MRSSSHRDSACPAGSWSARAAHPAQVVVPPPGPYDGEVHAPGGRRRIIHRADHRLEFAAALDDDEVPPPVLLVQSR